MNVQEMNLFETKSKELFIRVADSVDEADYLVDVDYKFENIEDKNYYSKFDILLILGNCDGFALVRNNIANFVTADVYILKNSENITASNMPEYINKINDLLLNFNFMYTNIEIDNKFYETKAPVGKETLIHKIKGFKINMSFRPVTTKQLETALRLGVSDELGFTNKLALDCLLPSNIILSLGLEGKFVGKYIHGFIYTEIGIFGDTVIHAKISEPKYLKILFNSLLPNYMTVIKCNKIKEVKLVLYVDKTKEIISDSKVYNLDEDYTEKLLAVSERYS